MSSQTIIDDIAGSVAPLVGQGKVADYIHALGKSGNSVAATEALRLFAEPTGSNQNQGALDVCREKAEK